MKYLNQKIIFLLFLNTLLFHNKCEAQQKQQKFSISAGYGLAGSFFVSQYVESLPFPSNNYGNFSKKNFIGSSQEFSIGYRLNKNYELNAGIDFQHFERRVKASDTLASVNIYIDKTLQERNYIYFANLSRVFERKKDLFHAGLGLYYIRYRSESIEYGTGIPNFYSNYEARYDNSKEEEGGAFVELAYEYKFQPRVNIGIKTQFYYTISIASAESITLFPYVKILF